MPIIEKKYLLENVVSDDINKDCLGIFRNLGAAEIREDTAESGIKEIIAVIPSIWGWGSLHLIVHLQQTQNNGLAFSLRGEIGQLATSPLTKLMDKFLQQLQIVLKEKYGQGFEYEKLTHFFPVLTGDNPDKSQLKVFLTILLICGALPLSILYLMKYITENFNF